MSVSLRRHLLLASPALLLAACASETPQPVAAAPGAPAAGTPEVQTDAQPAAQPDARVEMTNWQIGYIGQVGWGSGVLTYRCRGGRDGRGARHGHW